MSAVLKAQAAGLEWVGVSSSNLAAVAYSPDFARLFVRFKSGSTYSYEDVPLGIYQGLLAAPSKGEYLNAVVKRGNRFVYRGPF